MTCAHCGNTIAIERVGNFWRCPVCARRWPASPTSIAFRITAAVLALGVAACVSTTSSKPVIVSTPPAQIPVVQPIRSPNAGEQGALHVDGARFVKENGDTWIWRGLTDFHLLRQVCSGEDITPALDEAVTLGANLVRVLGMAHNLFVLEPQHEPDYWGCLHSLVDQLAARGLRIEFVIFADAQVVLPDLPTQRFHFTNVVNALADRWNVVLELCNECDKNGVDPSQFQRPTGVLMSHGSGQTDADPPPPRWDFAGYHARRDAAKGISNYSPYEFQAVYPQPVPLVPDEGAKPENYGFDPQYAYLMGRHAAAGMGGTFHDQAGVDGRLRTSAEAACAEAFFRGLSQ